MYNRSTTEMQGAKCLVYEGLHGPSYTRHLALGYSNTVQLFLLSINVLCRTTSVYKRSTTEVQVPSALCTRGLKQAGSQLR